MKYQKLVHILWVCALFISYGFSCYDCDEEIYDTSYFDGTIIPLKKVYQKNDTISLHAFFDPKIVLEKSKKTFDLTGYQVGFFFNLFEVLPLNDTIRGGKEKFEIMTSKGRLYNSTKGYDFNLWSEATKDSCGFDLTLIPREPGYYCVGISKAHCTVSDCEYYYLKVLNFNGENSNFEICNEIKTNRLIFGSTWLSDLSNPRSTVHYYFFKVT